MTSNYLIYSYSKAKQKSMHVYGYVMLKKIG